MLPFVEVLKPDNINAIYIEICKLFNFCSLSRLDPQMTDYLPDLMCFPLLTSNNSDLKRDLLLPSLPQSGSEPQSIPQSQSTPQSQSGSQNQLPQSVSQSSISSCVTGSTATTASLPQPGSLSSRSSCQQHQTLRYRQHSRSRSMTLPLSTNKQQAISFQQPSSSPSHSIDTQSSGATDHALHHNREPSVSLPISSSLGDILASEGDNSCSYDTSEGLHGVGRSTMMSASHHYKNVVTASTPLVSYSLDEGLDHIKDVVNIAKAIEIFSGKDAAAPISSFANSATNSKPVVDSKNATGSLTNLTKDKSLIVVSSSIDFEDSSLACFEDQTTTLLRSWNEDNPCHYSGKFATCGSTDLLEEVGVEVTESFMNKESHETLQDSHRTSSVVASSPIVPSNPVARSTNFSTAPSDCGTEPGEIRSNDDNSRTKTEKNVIKHKMLSISLAETKTESKKKRKSKSKGFWPFSRSNTSEESSKESNPSTTDVTVSSLDSSSHLSSLEADEQPLQQANKISTRRPSSPSEQSSTPKYTSSHSNNIDISASVQPNNNSAITPTTDQQQSTAPSSSHAVSNSSSAVSAAADALLLESLAALDCGADLSDVADRTAKLASKTFSFKMGAKS